MNREKNPFNSDVFSKIYACAFEKEKSGYEISKEIYGYDKKAHYILEKIRSYPEYFETIQNINNKNPKYRSKVNPLVNILFKKGDIDANTKRRFRNAINTVEFRKYIIYGTTVYNHYNIITFISFIAGSFYVFRHHYAKQVNELKKLGLNMDIAKQIAKKAEYQYKKETAIKKNNLSYTDFFMMGTKLSETFNKLPNSAINHLIKQSPLALLIPKTTIAVLAVNDALWEYRIKKLK